MSPLCPGSTISYHNIHHKHLYMCILLAITSIPVISFGSWLMTKTDGYTFTRQTNWYQYATLYFKGIYQQFFLVRTQGQAGIYTDKPSIFLHFCLDYWKCFSLTQIFFNLSFANGKLKEVIFSYLLPWILHVHIGHFQSKAWTISNKADRHKVRLIRTSGKVWKFTELMVKETICPLTPWLDGMPLHKCFLNASRCA